VLDSEFRWFVPQKIESDNKFKFAAKWWAYRRYASRWYHILSMVIASAPLEVTSYARVRIHSLRARLLDEGNLVGGAKPIPDYLVKAGWLVDDCPEWCRVTYTQDRAPKDARGTWIGIDYGKP